MTLDCTCECCEGVGVLPCPDCYGSGIGNFDEGICLTCEGMGEVECPTCEGTGEEDDQ